MPAIHIFKAGTHTDMHGTKLPFTQSDLAACVKAYDPSVHEAPLVIGHPKTEDPAWGWVKSLSLNGGDLLAEPDQLDPQFAELVGNGRFKKVSASFYLPDSPNNPKPGTLYLRHVGFLGAQPPSIKGLKQVSFGEKEEGVVEFADWSDITNASLWGRLRDFLIAQFGLDETDKVLPSWQVDSLREEAYRDTGKSEPDFSEHNPNPQQENSTMTEDEIKALQAENTRLKAEATQRAEQEAKSKQDKLHADNVSFAEKLVGAGRLTPAAKPVVVAILDAVAGGDKPVEFAEGDTRTPLATAFKTLLDGTAPVLNFSEHATKDRVNTDIKTTSAEFAEADPERLALHQKALELSKKEGISYDAAVSRCL
ncbi:TPA: peptidase [Salmonella enterica subsp. enterica serovar Montevideo]|nr:peptidase [Salmonella enterica]ECE9829575.1 peptidase [Salmonella enterica subsp. enterica serovar Montevideo]EDT4638941.1 peptidase [Salmonella enterica subsp. enterica]ELN4639729.1 peptidase [Escherichia coli]MDU4097519.1 peptidase [Enterobacter hormaechei]